MPILISMVPTTESCRAVARLSVARAREWGGRRPPNDVLLPDGRPSDSGLRLIGHLHMAPLLLICNDEETNE